MRYIWQHIRFIIDNYDGSQPLAQFLKTYLRKFPKLGSRDRKILAEMAYSYYRFSKALPKDMPFEKKVQACVFLGELNLPQILQLIPIAWQGALQTGATKADILKEDAIHFDEGKLKPFSSPFSEGYSPEDWKQSLLVQPRLFIRIRKDPKGVLDTLKKNEVAFEPITDQCISFPNGTAIDKLLPADSYVVQDASSQKAASRFKPEVGQEWWDVCAGAGGKSLMLKDLEPKVALTVSDIRESIITNLKERFKQYHIKPPTTFVADMTNSSAIQEVLGSKRFHSIICDVPCTGSGTWGRTPEQLYFFKEAQIKKYAETQKKIALNAAGYLKNNARLYYITCSVFKAENEEVVEHILANSPLKLVEKELINGTAIHADSMFVAVFESANT
jgi:16S rRNA (cytosine967-C5)-methyltransferase